ncbi:MAG: 50S ribosomal protein L32, partial [Thermoflexales bacterium]
RRAHDFLTPTGLAACPTCGKPKPPHIVCPSCGEYRGRAVVSVARPEAEEGDGKK